MRKVDFLEMGFKPGDRVKWYHPAVGEFVGVLLWDAYDKELYFMRDGCEYPDDSSNWFYTSSFHLPGVILTSTTEVHTGPAIHVPGCAD